MKTRKILLAAFFSGSITTTVQASMLLGNPEHGKQLHDEKCVGCHISKFGGDGSGVYTRENRRVNSIEGLTGQVHACNDMTHAELSEDDINDLIIYLNEAVYKFED
ncbi:MAG: cytochrome c [Gammaproteobacteria bacterium]|nr:MAG: cytochrome c [Gammaproteobacteria bacterium]